MRRSSLLKVTVHCPHFDKPVVAERNLAIDRLVSCNDAERCRGAATVGPGVGRGADHARPYPHGCPVFPSLAK